MAISKIFNRWAEETSERAQQLRDRIAEVCRETAGSQELLVVLDTLIDGAAESASIDLN